MDPPKHRKGHEKQKIKSRQDSIAGASIVIGHILSGVRQGVRIGIRI